MDTSKARGGIRHWGLAALALLACWAAGCGIEPLTTYGQPNLRMTGRETFLVLPFMDTRTFVDPKDPLKDTAGTHVQALFASALREHASDARVLAPADLERPKGSLTVDQVAALGKEQRADYVIAGQIFNFNEGRVQSGISARAGMFLRVVSVPDGRLVFVGDHYTFGGQGKSFGDGARERQARGVADLLIASFLPVTGAGAKPPAAAAAETPPPAAEVRPTGRDNTVRLAPAEPPAAPVKAPRAKAARADAPVTVGANQSLPSTDIPTIAATPAPASNPAPAAETVNATPDAPATAMEPSPAPTRAEAVPEPVPSAPTSTPEIPTTAKPGGPVVPASEVPTASPSAAPESPATEPAPTPSTSAETPKAPTPPAAPEIPDLPALPAAPEPLVADPVPPVPVPAAPDAPQTTPTGPVGEVPAPRRLRMSAESSWALAMIMPVAAGDENTPRADPDVIELDAPAPLPPPPPEPGTAPAALPAQPEINPVPVPAAPANPAALPADEPGPPDLAVAVPADPVTVKPSEPALSAPPAPAPDNTDTQPADPSAEAVAAAPAAPAVPPPSKPEAKASPSPATEKESPSVLPGKLVPLVVTENPETGALTWRIVPAETVKSPAPAGPPAATPEAETAPAAEPTPSTPAIPAPVAPSKPQAAAPTPAADAPEIEEVEEVNTDPRAAEESDRPEVFYRALPGAAQRPRAGNTHPRLLLLPYYDRPNDDNLILHTGGGEVVTALYAAALSRIDTIELLLPPPGRATHDRLPTPEEAVALAREADADFVLVGEVVEFRRAQSTPSWLSAAISTYIIATQIILAEMSGVHVETRLYRVADGALIHTEKDVSRQKYVVQAEKTVRRLAAGTAPALAAAMQQRLAAE